MAKEKTKEKEDIVKIRKLKTNFELRFNYLKILSEFIKRFPKEHRQIRIDNVVDSNGDSKDQWVRIIREVEIGKLISFMIDNNIKFVFENLTKDEITRLQNEYIARLKRIHEALKMKADNLDVSNEDYSFLKKQPYEYQKKAIKFFEINEGKAILGDQPGVGKTLPAFAYAAKHQLKSLIISPSPLKLMWKDQIMEFTKEKAFVYGYKPSKKSLRKGIAYKKEEALFHAVNYELIESYVSLEYNHKCKGNTIGPDKKQKKCGWEQTDLVKKYKKCPICENVGSVTSRVSDVVFFSDKVGDFIDPKDYDLIIVDEFHRMKNEKTSWTKIIKKAFRDTIKKKILISGTAIKSRPMELFSGLNFLSPEEWNSSHDYGVRYCAGYESNFGWDYSGASNLEELYERISPYFLRRLKKDVLKELPPKTYTNIYIQMTDAEEREYNKLEKSIAGELSGEEPTEKTKEGFLEKIHKLNLFTGKIKLNRVMEIIQDIVEADEKVVVFSDRLEITNGVHKAFEDISVIHTGEQSSEEQNEAEFSFQNNKKIKVFAGSIMSAGVGITLTAASKLIKIGFSWTPADEEQTEDRIHRASTTADNVQILTLIVQGTIDEDRYELLMEKSQVVSRVLDNKNFKREVNVSDEGIFKALVKRITDKN